LRIHRNTFIPISTAGKISLTQNDNVIETHKKGGKMALMTPAQFEERLKAKKPRVFMNGKQVDDILENKNTRTVVEANKASYAWALDPQYEDIMSCYSSLIDDKVNRYTHVSASIDDLVKKAEAGTWRWSFCAKQGEPAGGRLLPRAQKNPPARVYFCRMSL